MPAKMYTIYFQKLVMWSEQSILVHSTYELGTADYFASSAFRYQKLIATSLVGLHLLHA